MLIFHFIPKAYTVKNSEDYIIESKFLDKVENIVGKGENFFSFNGVSKSHMHQCRKNLQSLI